jgi:hypothetical protein
LGQGQKVHIALFSAQAEEAGILVQEGESHPTAGKGRVYT